MRLLGHASNIARWADLADFLAAPVIVTLVVVSVIVGAKHRILAPGRRLRRVSPGPRC